MKKFVVFLCLFLFSSVYSLSSAEVTNFFRSETHYLESNQSFSENPFFIEHENSSYWVVVLLSDRTPTGFVALPSNEKKVIESSKINRKLFRTAYVLYSIKSYRGSSNWIFSNSNRGKFDSLSKILSSDVPFKLNSIKQGTSNESIRAKVDLMNSMLSLMSSKAGEISDSLNNAISLELKFTSTPSTKDTDELKKAYEKVFSLLQEFKDLKSDYSLSVIELKKLISDSDISASEKEQFLALATEPQQLNSINSIFSLSEDVSQRVQEIYFTVDSQVNFWVDDVSLMVKRNSAFNEIYGEDKTFYSKTKNGFYSLNEAFLFVSSEENAPFWKEQEKLSSLKKNFSEAKKAFEQKNYDRAISYAKKAKSNVIVIVSSGFYEDKNVLTENIQAIIFGLIALLVALLLFNNRKKFFSSKEEIKEFKF
jgi:hypothetical protein